MNKRMKRVIVLGALAAMLAVGGGVAVAGGGLGFGKADREAFQNDVAKRLNVTPEALQSALQGAYADRLDAAVAAGELTKAQADELKQRMADGGGLPFFGGGHGKGFGDHKPPSLTAAATYLGLTQVELRTQLKAGTTLADIAEATDGKTVAGLKSALAADAKTKLDAAVKAGKLTQAAADEMQAEMTAHLDDLVNGTGRLGHRGHGGSRHGWGGAPDADEQGQAPAAFAPAGYVS